ncbi:hypothetical protein [Staphylospora marina]|uniref:hypothetical protein n=1 Tax=Staphylospora marina TaxID=2490858 RepID=UPI000F5C1A67|nr:hypothetical protein [Staphylospora marina]
MRIADWLTYADIEHLRRLNRFYGTGGEKIHSKHELIVSLLQVMGRKPPLRRNMEQLSEAEQRFLELIVLDPTPAFTMEELKAKAAAASNDEADMARELITGAVSRGWLFPGYSPQTQHLYHIPSDLRERMLELLCEPFAGDVSSTPPEVYRDEQGQMVADLVHFLDFLRGDIVRLTNEGAIWRQQQKQLFKTFFIPEEPISEKSPRFGFGRKYHLYPDRFSLLYDYAWYHGYILEDEEGYLCLTDKGIGKISDTLDEGASIFRFWIRLYRKPVPHLPVVIRWIGLLGAKGWIGVDTVKSAVMSWISPFYYETPDSLFVKILKMMSHLGVIRIGSEQGRDRLTLTESGREWLAGTSAFRERVIEEGFIPG